MKLAELHTIPALEGEELQNFWQKTLTALQSLQTPLGVTASGPDDHFYAIFGRDSLWTVMLALEAERTLREQERNSGHRPAFTLAYPAWLQDFATTVLRGLASLQGQVVNDFNDEQPGRIVHEYWNPVPQNMRAAHWPVADGNGRYYGSFDATFLYVCTVARVTSFFDDAVLLAELWPSVEAALQWMLAWSDLDHDGRVEYQNRNPDGFGLNNQVWKDSGDSIRSREHAVLEHPLAWVEVQGYAWAAYDAYLEMAQRRRALDAAREAEIRRRMDGLLHGLQQFRFAHEHVPAMALDAEKNPIEVVSSNIGHLLWSGCLAREQAEHVWQRLAQPDMLTSWGIRTLSEQAYFYNPLKYHCGSIWPFDNAIIVSGLQRYGFTEDARYLANAILSAIRAFTGPVELYTVQPAHWLRSHRIAEKWFLADYSDACSVQAWTTSAMLYLGALFM
ncbi:MAG TPA: hypothetical protein VHZ51_05735 [Ktedonobacteraceae bacterium]|nr:hypothetical protein [Ktedonobacteraceae bacterium]